MQVEPKLIKKFILSFWMLKSNAICEGETGEPKKANIQNEEIVMLY